MKTFLYDKQMDSAPKRQPPERYKHVQHTQMSIARHFGGIRVNGAEYVYVPETDELVRIDVWKAEKKEQKRLALERKKWEEIFVADAEEQMELIQQQKPSL